MRLFSRKPHSGKNTNAIRHDYFKSPVFGANRQAVLAALSALPYENPPGWELPAVFAIGGLDCPQR